MSHNKSHQRISMQLVQKKKTLYVELHSKWRATAIIAHIRALLHAVHVQPRGFQTV